ncbi:MAG: RtcB family protein [Zestosphaera sp.]
MKVPLKRVNEYEWEIPSSYKDCMKVPAIIFADEFLISKMSEDLTLEQAANVGCLPGIEIASYVMPDGHQGYGFPIGGVAGVRSEDGYVSPGGVGYDINCGVRLLRTNLSLNDVRDKIKELVDTIFRNVPSGVGSTGKLKLSFTELDKVLNEGVDWAISRGFGWEEDREFIESYGRIEYADASKVSNTAKSRGADQLGTLGAGNHFLEIQVVDKIYDEKLAKAMGIDHEGQITIMVHTGSRGLGHQVASDYLGVMERAMRKYGFAPPDRELASVPFNSREGQDYFKAMAAAANYAFTNRQIITHWVRESVAKVFGTKPENLDLRAIYDVAHNIAKLEEHEVRGKNVKLVVHRKGATRAFPPGHPEIPKVYRNIGQPVLIPGSMGTASYLMVGIPEGKRTFYSAAHGAGRWLSRNEALRRSRADAVLSKLLSSGIYVKATSKETVVEEMPEAYKDVDRVALVSHKVGIAALVARMRPLGVVKG